MMSEEMFQKNAIQFEFKKEQEETLRMGLEDITQKNEKQFKKTYKEMKNQDLERQNYRKNIKSMQEKHHEDVKKLKNDSKETIEMKENSIKELKEKEKKLESENNGLKYTKNHFENEYKNVFGSFTSLKLDHSSLKQNSKEMEKKVKDLEKQNKLLIKKQEEEIKMRKSETDMANKLKEQLNSSHRKQEILNSDFIKRNHELKIEVENLGKYKVLYEKELNNYRILEKSEIELKNKIKEINFKNEKLKEHYVTMKISLEESKIENENL